MWLSLQHSCGCKKIYGGIIKVKHYSPKKKFRVLMNVILSKASAKQTLLSSGVKFLLLTANIT